MQNKSGFPVKRAYPGKLGLYIELFTEQDALGLYAQGVATGSRIEMQDNHTVIMKFSESPTTMDAL